jgi:chromosomal replication initiator protein
VSSGTTPTSSAHDERREIAEPDPSSGTTDLPHLWARCMFSLRERVSAPTWNAWLAPLVPLSAAHDRFILAAPNSMVFEQVTNRLVDLIRHTLAELLPVPPGTELPSVEIVVQPGLPPFSLEPSPTGPESLVGDWSITHSPTSSVPQTSALPSSTDHLGPNVSTPPSSAFQPDHFSHSTNSQLTDHFPTSHPPRYTFQAFVIGASNRFAHAAALAVAERPAKAYNPLFIYGPSGLGKTHLLHAIRYYVNDNFPALKVRYVSTETFLNEFIEAIHKRDQAEFKRRYRAHDVLLVDDIHFIENKRETQEEFFYTFNTLYEAEKQVVLCSDRHPRAIGSLEDRLRSRFESGLMTDIQPPELETRLAILLKKASAERVSFPENVLELIATHVKDNIRELEGALTRLSAFASIHRVPVTRQLAEDVLSDLIAANAPRTITPELILATTAEAFGFTVEEICGPSRRRPLVAARQTAMYLFRHLLPDFSFPIIAKHFGDRDHTTVMHAERKIEALMKDKPQIFEQVTGLILKIRQG